LIRLDSHHSANWMIGLVIF